MQNSPRPSLATRFRNRLARDVARLHRRAMRLRVKVTGPLPLPDVKPVPGDVQITDLLPASERGVGLAPDGPFYPGAHYAAFMAQARSTTKPDGSEPALSLVNMAFDHANYVVRTRPFRASVGRMDFVQHYMRQGVSENRNPSPHFSTEGYLARNPDLGENPFSHWLRTGLAEGRIASPLMSFEKVSHALGQPADKMQLEQIKVRCDLRERLETGTLGAMVAKATAHEPLVAQVWPQATIPHIQPFHVPRMADALGVIHGAQEQAAFQRARVVVCVNAPRWGAGRRLEGHLAFALAALYGPENVLMMSVDGSGEMPGWKRPEGVRYVDFAAHLAGAENAMHERLLLGFLRSLRPQAVFNVNSRLLWRVLGQYGSVMREDVPVVGCFFCNDRSDLGFEGGYPASQFYRCFDSARGFATDSHFLRGDLIAKFAVPPEQQARMHVLEAPVDTDIPLAPRPVRGDGRLQVFWAGRLDAQKRIDVLYRIARAMPQVDFRVWGKAIAGGIDETRNPPPNIRFEGAYEVFTDLPLGQADAWLYTSAWDGVPSILLEVAMTGVPLVGSDVGGTREVLQPGLACAVTDVADVPAYVAGLQAVLDDPDTARTKAKALRARLLETRTDAAYRQMVQHLVEGDLT